MRSDSQVSKSNLGMEKPIPTQRRNTNKAAGRKHQPVEKRCSSVAGPRLQPWGPGHPHRPDFPRALTISYQQELFIRASLATLSTNKIPTGFQSIFNIPYNVSGNIYMFFPPEESINPEGTDISKVKGSIQA